MTSRAITVQVKANDAPKPGRGQGKLALDSWIADDCPSEFAAFVDISTVSAWLLTKPEFASLAQQHSSGWCHFYVCGPVGENAGRKTRHAKNRQGLSPERYNLSTEMRGARSRWRYVRRAPVER